MPSKDPRPSKELHLKPSFRNSGDPSFVVGIGASAGGLEAFTELLRGLPADTQMAFVLVQHLDPLHQSMLAALLSKSTSIPVAEVTDGTRVRPGRIYVIPPNTGMSITKGVLHLSARKDVKGRHMSIDAFFESLAADLQEKAVGIILSGSESDGVRGLEKIKAEGGITFAQDEGSAKFKDMPRRAAASGAVDFVMPPQEIAGRLSRLLSPHASFAPQEELPFKDDRVFSRLLEHLKNAAGMDFTLYKHPTIMRRISRRMILARSGSLKEYLGVLLKSPEETQALRRDILISVTSFFRDPGSFEFLKRRIFPEILKRRKKDASIRIWVAGCSTGNEAYSIAIALDEILRGRSVPVQIFATDVSSSAVDIARRGFYPEGIRSDVSSHRLERYFNKLDGGYQIKKSIRDRCVFAVHNVLSDPPFSDMDLISCRNVLIYMEPPLQKRAISFFHYSLKPLGFLTLGGSETVGGFSAHFSVVDRKRKVYSKRRSSGPERRIRFVPEPAERRKSQRKKSDSPAVPEFDTRKEASRLAALKKAKNGVLVTDSLEIVEFFGKTSSCIRPAAGQASFSLMQMVHDNMLPDLCIAICEARRRMKPVRKILPAARHVKILAEVVPIRTPSKEETYFLILLHENESRMPVSRSAANEIRALKRDLHAAKESLTAIMREQGGIAEEFRSQNEEIRSSNEEFQSTNEELETAKEELQSSNEELTTVNNEMEARNAELIQANDDLNNLILSVHTSIVLVDAGLRVRRFTAQAGKSMGFIATDIGRKISDIRLNLPVADLEAFLREVMDTLERKEREVADPSGYFYLMIARPFRRQDGKIDGAVLMFVDITEIKNGMALIDDSRRYSETVIQTLWEPLIALDSRNRIKSANNAFYEFFHLSPDETVGKGIYDLLGGAWNIPPIKRLLEDLADNTGSLRGVEIEYDFPRIGHRFMILNAHKIAMKEGRKEQAVILAFHDVTDQRHSEDSLNRIAAELFSSNKELESFASTAAHDLRSPVNKIQIFAERLLGEIPSEKGKSYLNAMIKSSERMGRLIENLLLVSRVSTDGHEQECVGLDGLIGEVLSDLEISIHESGSVVERVGLPAISANRIQMHQLFQNLIGNAIKYRKADEAPRIRISTRFVGDSLEIAVEDNGIGFDPKYSLEVFKPFKRLQGTSAYEGSGIGLSLCQKIVRYHGGEITVQSRPGVGSTFFITWPKTIVCATPERPACAPKDA